MVTSLRKYMVIDLAILALIGCLVELLGIYLFNAMLTATMITSAVSLLMMLISTTRWGYKGLIIAPLLALATIISGRFFNVHAEFKALYDWKLYLVILISLLSFAVNLLWYKKIDYRQNYKKISTTVGICLLDIVVSQLVLSLAYLAFYGQFLLLGFIVWNAFAFVILIIGAIVLSKQGVIVNIKQNLLERKEELELEKKLEFNFEENEDKENNIEKKEGEFKNGQSS